MSKEKLVPTVDGRRLRSERSRQVILDAMMALTEEGNLVPTAQQVADRAGVGIRSVFRHFSDMENLFAAADEQSREWYVSLFAGGDRNGTLPERIKHAVERHADGFEATWNTIRCTHAQMWRYEILRKNYARYQRGLRKDLDDWLPELKALPRSRRDAVDAIASFEMWHRLREYQGLNRKQSIVIVVDLLTQLIPEA